MTTEQAYYIGRHKYHFRPDQPALIIGVKIITNGDITNLCYHVQYSDMAEDFPPVKEPELYDIVTFKDLLKR